MLVIVSILSGNSGGCADEDSSANQVTIGACMAGMAGMMALVIVASMGPWLGLARRWHSASPSLGPNALIGGVAVARSNSKVSSLSHI